MTNLKDKFKQIEKAPHGFCLAKWYQVTIDLSRGVNHSCHHPERHSNPLSEIKASPSALHNTEFKLEQRKKMLEGIRPSECEYCWKIEDTPGENYSDRFIKSTDDWAFDKLEDTLTLPWNTHVAPTYIEVMFSSECNLNCMYCMADASTSIEREMKKHGPYPVKSNQHRMQKIPAITGENPYTEAFWKYLPEIYSKLKVFRITGGEPLLSGDTFKFLDFLEINPNPNLELAVNTNLSYSLQLCEKLVSYVKVLLAKKCIKKFTIFTSIDGFGEQAAYIRQGLSLSKFMSNIELINKTAPDIEIVLMCSFNILSISSFPKLLEWTSKKKSAGLKITLDISYLKNPEYLRASLADKSLLLKLDNILEQMKSNPQFSNYEVLKLERVVNWVHNSYQDAENLQFRADFYSFIEEFDKRFNTDFNLLFPELKSFYSICYKSHLWARYEQVE
jgi:organic radical activating enzyme